MAAKDIFHEAVSTALQKEGWLITHDPYYVKTDLLDNALKIDLGAERLLAAEKGTEKIAVEVKSFLKESLVTDFYLALGQTLAYQVNLNIQEPERRLYLAIPEAAYNKMQQQSFFSVIFQQYNIHLIIFDSNQQIITEWLT